MHAEFSNFLATQAIDKAEWDQIKIEKPEVAEQELDVFSDLVWEGVLSKTEFLEHFSKNHIFLFQCFDTYVKSIVLKSLVPETNIDHEIPRLELVNMIPLLPQIITSFELILYTEFSL